MQWERKRPLWPIVAALSVLLALTLAAPLSWQRSNSPVPTTSIESSVPELQLPLETIVQEAPSSVPLPAQPELAAPTIVEPVLPPTVRIEFDLDALAKVRDALWTILDQVPTPQDEAPQASSARVRVSSESDRLAMVVPRPSIDRQPTPSIVVPPTAEEEATTFAELLLEAASQPDPPSLAGPRLATLPAKPDRGPVLQPVEPSPAQPPVLQPSLVEPPVAQPTMAQPTMSQPALQTASPLPVAPTTPLPPTIQPPTPLPPALRHRPSALVKQLEDFEVRSPGAVWAQQVLAKLRLLTEKQAEGQPEAAATLAELVQLYETGIRHSANLDGPSYQNDWRQAALALGRRLTLWQLLLDETQPRVIESSPATTALLPIISDVANLLDQAEAGAAWRDYLLLDRIAEAMSEGINAPTLTRAKVAQTVLARMTDPQLTQSQLDFLAEPLLVELRDALKPWAAGKVNLETLAALVERYESGRETRYAAVIAQLQQRLKWSDDPRLQALATDLDQNYRGANMRIAMSDKLMNRMLPAQKPIVTPVRDRIANTKVRGRARTTTQLNVKLLPDSDAWHVALVAKGKVYSDTRSDTWPARIRNAAKMQYEASKEISLSQQGVSMSPAKATARGRNELIGVDSQLDPIPIVSHLLRDFARQKHKKNRPLANSQAKAKVVRQAKQRMDKTLEERLEVLEERFRDKVLAPMEELALLAEPLDMHTTDERAVMQLRLANMGQLAAHTSRPLAPSDSLLSLQMHETALNNAMMGLGLDGRRMTMLELFDFLTARFGRTDATPPADMPKKAIIQFAKHDAVRVKCDGDRLEVVLSVVELAHRRDKIKNFEIHVHFRPILNGLSVKLVRDGSLQFSGRRLKTGPRVVLHSILGKILQEDQEYNLVNSKLMLDPRFAGLMVTQLVLEDGWIGLALGPAHPRRTAWRAPLPEVLDTPFVR